jgi:hypothetical protein
MKLGKVAITHELLKHFITEGYGITSVECTDGIPDDAEFVRSYSDDELGVVYLIYHHETFSDIPPGGKVPVIAVEYRRFYGI